MQRDGNCFPRCVSKLLFGTEDHRLAIGATLVYEAIINKNFYLDNTYLEYGAVGDRNLKSQFAIYSEAYKKVKTINWNDHTLFVIYEQEVLEMRMEFAYCGMWQFYQASNVICRPLRSVYPFGFLSEEYRQDTNRIAYPIRLHHREGRNACIMWTSMRLQGQPVHFVPLVNV